MISRFLVPSPGSIAPPLQVHLVSLQPRLPAETATVPPCLLTPAEMKPCAVVVKDRIRRSPLPRITTPQIIEASARRKRKATRPPPLRQGFIFQAISPQFRPGILQTMH